MRSGLILEGDRVRVFTRAAVREVDRVCIEEYGIPGIVLMENAARAIERVIEERYGERGKVLICCGAGNNGGDGFAVARLLANRGWEVRVVMTRAAEDYTGDAGINARVCQRMGIEMREWDGAIELRDGEIVVDALLGTGLDRAVGGVAAKCVEWINGAREQGVRVVAVDVPSGMDCDSGDACGGGIIVRADVTVTLGGMKIGLLKDCAREYCGEVVVGDIGAPDAVLKEYGKTMG